MYAIVVLLRSKKLVLPRSNTLGFMTDLSMNNKKARNLALFVGCVLFWIILDRITKVYIDTNYKTGDVIVQNILNLFQFDLVHNRGAAWALFLALLLYLLGLLLLFA